VTLPNFAVIGAGKSGTTAMYHWLRQHPDVFMPPEIKETFFFAYDPDNPEHVAAPDTRFPVRTLERYEALFANAGAATAIGEATPAYLNSPVAAAKMHELVPDARLVLSLREPVSRLRSMSQMSVRLGHATDLVAEMRRYAATDALLYAPNLRRWLALYDRSQMCVLRYEDLSRDPQAAMAQVFGFLGVDAGFTPDTSAVHNPGGLPRSAFFQRVLDSRVSRFLRPIAPMAAYNLKAKLRQWNAKPADTIPSEVTAELAARYRDDVLETQELLGLDLSGWLATSDSAS
jgi:hypothetical protein